MRSERSEGLHEATKALTLAIAGLITLMLISFGFAALVLSGRTNSPFCGDARAPSSDPLVDARKHLGLWPQAPSVTRAAVSLHLYQ